MNIRSNNIAEIIGILRVRSTWHKCVSKYLNDQSTEKRILLTDQSKNMLQNIRRIK